MNEPTLLGFFRDYLTWIDAGAPVPHDTFGRIFGLCSCLATWTKLALLSKDDRSKLHLELGDRLQKDFPKDNMYPFGRSAEFFARQVAETQHLNEARIAWVRKQIANVDIGNV